MITSRRPEEYDIIGKRRFHEMQPGDMFRARITDIQQGRVTLKFNDGTTYMARSQVLPDARIGEESVFLVRENDFEGRIVLEMVKLAPETKQENMLREVMQHAGITASDSNISFGRKLLAAGLPVDAATLQSNVLHKIIHAPPALLHALEATDLPGKYMDFNKPTKPGANPLRAYYQHMYQTALNEGHKEIVEILQFLLRTSRHRTYYQIPFIHRKTPYQADLHLLSRTHAKNALLAIETHNLGRLEITLNGTDIIFRSDKPESLPLLDEAAPQLTQALTRLGFPAIIKKADDPRVTEPFTLLTPLTGDEKASQVAAPRRFNFDMRV